MARPKKEPESELEASPAPIDGHARKAMLSDYRRSRRRLLLLDYDGTLVPFASRPELATPGPRVVGLLKRLSSVPGNEVVIISGRMRQVLDEWFGDFDISLVAEHGALLRRRGRSRWVSLGPLNGNWMQTVAPLLEESVDRVPGSFVEKKQTSLAWHYRNAVPGVGASQARELEAALAGIAEDLGVDVVRGHKVIEVKSAGVSKGEAALSLLRGKRYDFVLAIGDDTTDESVFCRLPRRAYTVRVGTSPSLSRFNLPSQRDVMPFLRELAGWKKEELEVPDC